MSPEEHAAVWKDVALKMRETALNQTDPHRAPCMAIAWFAYAVHEAYSNAAPKSPDSATNKHGGGVG